LSFPTQNIDFVNSPPVSVLGLGLFADSTIGCLFGIRTGSSGE
jgi:hypothetical protein